MKKILSLILLFNLMGAHVAAFELDTSIDDEIRKNYNPSKIEQDKALPALPKVIIESKTKPAPSNKLNTMDSSYGSSIIHEQSISKNSLGDNYVVLKKGTKFKLKLMNAVSDRTQRGTKVSFVSVYPVTTTYLTIPMGTVFKGEISDSHKPQLTANGGLVEININSMVLQSEVQPLTSRVIKVNSKKIFFNSIKGQRKYTSSMLKSMKPGCHFFNKMMRLTGTLARDGSSIVLAPFSLFAGVATVCANALVAPSVAVFYRGGSVSIPAGSIVEIKLVDDLFIY